MNNLKNMFITLNLKLKHHKKGDLDKLFDRLVVSNERPLNYL